MDILKRKNNNLDKILFSFTLFVILLRRYMIFNLEPTAFVNKSTSLLFYGSIALLMFQFILIKNIILLKLLFF